MLQLHRKKTGDTSYASFYAETDDRSTKEEDIDTIGVGPLAGAQHKWYTYCPARGKVRKNGKSLRLSVTTKQMLKKNRGNSKES